ncbi:ATP synthase subunit delta [Thermoanaerobacter sp. YS13]|uniref:ATP synthase F1 subunit delta n=1 Tax=Thermoanaerobacter sp. YS13 TaxID=1511746 RepID=UPI000575A7D2|nr:ATP synthase F1 subunit delta [Thermoanaerobacter sp. YS13]KHO61168.1 ATP synthase subunit delta [Thermoanaerobacter sp. YS13]
MAQVVAKRYAYALFDVAKQRDKVKEYYDGLEKVIEILQIGKVKQIFNNKSINKTQKIEFIEQILKDVDKEIVNFIKVIISKHREDMIEEIGEQFRNLYKEYFNIVNVKVVSAYPLKEDVLQKLQEKLEKKLEKHINIEPIVDKSILGGLKLIIGNTVIDGSIKARFTALLKNMQQAV